MREITELIARAEAVGAYAATLEIGQPAKGSSDHIHHLGDDTGRLITEAYRDHGVDAAAAVIEAYLRALNAKRTAANIRELTPIEAVHNLEWAIVPGGISPDEQAEVRRVFAKRNDILE